MASVDETAPRRTNTIAIVLLVLLALGAVGGVAAKIVLDQVRAQSELARGARARADLRTIVNAATLFKMHMGAWPARIDDLWTKPAVPDGRTWNGPYVPYVDVVSPLLDPWERPYQLVPGGSAFGVTCLVAGGLGADADLVDGPE